MHSRTWRLRTVLAGLIALAVLLGGSAALATPQTEQSPPGSVASVSITRADGSLTASWNAPSGATHYHVTYSSTNGASWQLAALDHASTSISISVDNAKTYIVGVRAKNAHGGSGWRNSPAAGPFTPPTPPDTVSSVSVTRADGTLTASWDAPSGATSYHVTYTDDNAQSWQLAALDHASTSITITADNTKTYIVGVRAKNSAGGSGWRNSPAAGPFTPAPQPPDAVASVTVTRDDGTLTASWSAPSRATHYHVTYTDDGAQSWQLAALSHTETSIEITADNDKTYIVGVRAKNAQGGSNWRNSASAGPFTPITLTPTEVTDDSATIQIDNYSGQWYYTTSETSGGGGGGGAGIASAQSVTCNGPVNGSEATITGLDSDTGYTITAYGNGQCGGAEIASATAQTQANLSPGQVSVSNLGQPPSGSYCAVGQYRGNIKCATAFTTGSRIGGYVLASVSGYFTAKTLDPGPIVVAVHEAHSNDPNRPGAHKVTLSGPNPDTTGTYTYTCSGADCRLAADTTYVVQMSASGNTPPPSYQLRTTLSDNEVNTPAGNGWSIADVGWSSNDIGAWRLMYGGNAAMLRVVATNAAVQMSASAETIDGATLTVTSGGQDAKGAWWYKQTEPNDSLCAKAGGSSVAVTGLLPGRAYTYAAYDNEKCHPDGSAEDTEDSAVATATFTTLYKLRVDGLTENSATLVIEGSLVIEEGKGKLKSWWYKRTAPSGDSTCYATGHAQKSVALSLTPGTSYTYAAYGDSGCSNQFSAPVSFKTVRLDSAVAYTPQQATLDLRNWTEAWWYKQIAPAGGPSCTSVTAGTTQVILDLSSVDYINHRDQFIVEAYDEAGCGADDRIAGTTFFPGSSAKGGVENVTATTATFLAYNLGANSTWGYKSTETGAECVGPFDGVGGQGVASAPVTGLTPGTTYTFQGYSSAQNNPCSARFDSNVTFTTAPASVSNLGQRQVGSTMPVGRSRQPLDGEFLHDGNGREQLHPRARNAPVRRQRHRDAGPRV